MRARERKKEKEIEWAINNESDEFSPLTRHTSSSPSNYFIWMQMVQAYISVQLALWNLW